MQAYEIFAGPSWIESERFEIDGRFEGDDVPSRMVPMLRQVLLDRFKLKFHREMRQVPIYALKAARGGAKLKAAPAVKDATAPAVKMRPAPGRLIAENQTMSGLSDFLTRSLGRRVLNQTALPGVYDFVLQWTPDEYQKPPLRPDAPPADPNGPSIFTAPVSYTHLTLPTIYSV